MCHHRSIPEEELCWGNADLAAEYNSNSQEQDMYEEANGAIFKVQQTLFLPTPCFCVFVFLCPSENVQTSCTDTLYVSIF